MPKPSKKYDNISTEVQESSQFLQSNEFNDIVAKRLEKALDNRKLKQKDLSNLTGIKPDVISKIKNGHMNLTLERAWLIAKALNVSIDYLYGNSDYETPEQHAVGIIEKHIFVDTKSMFATNMNELVISKHIDNYFKAICDAQTNEIMQNGNEGLNELKELYKQKAREYLVNIFKTDKENYIEKYINSKDTDKIQVYQLID